MATKAVRYRIDSIDIDLTEDKYEEGMVGGDDDCVIVDEKGPNKAFDSLEELFAYAVNRWNLLEDRGGWEIEPDWDQDKEGPLVGTRLTTQWNVDKDQCAPSKAELILWEEGKFRLWTATVNLYILRTEEENVPEDEVKAFLKGASK
jgi:hypothetical protein